MTARRIGVLDVQFSDPRLARLVQMINRMGTEMQRMQDLLDGGQAGQVLVKTTERDYDGTWSESDAAGEANTGENVGTGLGLFIDKDGVALRFRSLVEGDNIVLELDEDGAIVISATTDASDLDPCLIAGCF